MRCLLQGMHLQVKLALPTAACMAAPAKAALQGFTLVQVVADVPVTAPQSLPAAPQCGVHQRAGRPLTCCTPIWLLLDNVHAVMLAGRSSRVKVGRLIVWHSCWLHARVLPQGARQEGVACGGCTVWSQGCRHHQSVR